jgi:tetratricopeptide (TPR) repeat protein
MRSRPKSAALVGGGGNKIGGSMLTDELGRLEQAREIAARERLEELQALARTYRNWSVKELAHALGRQPGRLVPDSGMPKIDLVVGLAKALDWPVEAVVDHLMKPASSSRGAVVQQDTAADYATLYNKSLEMRLARDYAEAIRLAVRAGAVADNPTRRAAALIIEAQAHESMGSFTESVRCLGMATRFDGVEADWRLYVDAHLANMLFMQGHVTQALGVATSVLEYGEKLQPTVRTSTARMLAHWSRANVLRSAIPSSGEIDAWRPLAESARSDLHAARDLGNELMQDVSDKPIYFRNFVGSIEPLLLELDTICDSALTEQAMRTLIEMVRSTSDGELGHGQRKAWAAVAIASIARRFVSDEMQRRGLLELASAALRSHAVATSNWYFAHRHLEIDAERRRSLSGNGVAPRALDAVEAKLVAGVLGQVPGSRGDAAEYMALYAGREGGRP